MEWLIGIVIIVVCAVLAVLGFLGFGVTTYLNGDQVDLYEKAYSDYSNRRNEVISSLETANSRAIDLGIERLYATCAVAGTESEDVSTGRKHKAAVHDMELLSVSCSSVNEIHDSARRQDADSQLVELSRRAGIEGVTAAINGQRTNIGLKPLASDPGPAPELTFWDKRKTRKRPLRKIAEDIQIQILDLDQELNKLAHVNSLLADEYADLRLANLTLKSEIADGVPTEAGTKRVVLLLARPPWAEQLQAAP